MKHQSLLPTRILNMIALIILIAAVPLTAIADSSKLDGIRGDTSLEVSTNPPTYITWQDIVMLVNKHPGIVAGNHIISAARANIDAAGAIPNPEIEFSTLQGEPEDSSASTTEWGVGITIPLDWIAKRSTKIDVASADAKEAEAELRALRRNVLLKLRVLFWNLVYEQEHVVVLNELNNQMAELSTTIKKRVEKGEVRPIEATRMEVEAEKIVGELDVAKSTLTARRAQLATWFGIHNFDRLVAVSDIEQLPRPISSEFVRAKAGGHPIMAAAKARIQSLSANVVLEKKERVPSMSIKAFTDHEPDRNAYGIELAMDLPLWNWNTSNIKRSEYMLAAEKEKFEAEKLEIETRAIEAQSTCESGVALALRFKDRILPRATSVAQIIERTYEVGEATLLEVIDARRTLLETKRQYLKTLLKTQIDYGHLQTITGEKLP